MHCIKNTAFLFLGCVFLFAVFVPFFCNNFFETAFFKFFTNFPPNLLLDLLLNFLINFFLNFPPDFLLFSPEIPPDFQSGVYSLFPAVFGSAAP